MTMELRGERAACLRDESHGARRNVRAGGRAESSDGRIWDSRWFASYSGQRIYRSAAPMAGLDETLERGDVRSRSSMLLIVRI
jgi:hypothetical protein